MVPSSFVTADVQVRVIIPTIGQTMDQPGIAVEAKDDGLVLGEKDIEVFRSRPPLVLVRRRIKDRLRHYAAPDCRPHSAAFPERALPGPRSL